MIIIIMIRAAASPTRSAGSAVGCRRSSGWRRLAERGAGAAIKMDRHRVHDDIFAHGLHDNKTLTTPIIR